MPFFDIPFPPPLKAFVASKRRVASSQEQAPSRKMSWTTLGRSFTGVRKRNLPGDHSGQDQQQRRHSVQELVELASGCRSGTLPTLRERQDMAVDMAVSESGASGVVGNEVSGKGLDRVLSHLSSDSDWTAVPSEGTMTPSASLSRVSSYKKNVEDAFVSEDDKSSRFASEQSFEWPTMAVPSDPDFQSLPTVKLVSKKANTEADDDLAYLEQMMNGPQVFIPTNPYIYDGPGAVVVPARPHPVSRRRLASVRSQ